MTQFNEPLLVKSANIASWLDGCERQGHVLLRTISAGSCGWHLELGESGMGQATTVVTPGSKEASAGHWTRTATETAVRLLDCASM